VQERAGEGDERDRDRAQVVAVGSRDVSCLEPGMFSFLLYSLFTKTIIYRLTNNNDDYDDHLHDQRWSARDRVREGDKRFLILELTSRGLPSIFGTEILYLKLDEFSFFLMSNIV
jgi:hypothetical protein